MSSSSVLPCSPLRVGEEISVRGRDGSGAYVVRKTTVTQRHLDVLRMIRPLVRVLDANDLTITYADLSAVVDGAVHYRSWGPYLDVLCADSERRGEIPMGDVVVTKATGTPGHGFLELALKVP